jgi:glycosyltransferase involved in cell wall biosynthesis
MPMLARSVMPTYTFSAVVPNYNDAASVGRAVASLAAQTVPLHEILVIDDGSTDDSVEVITRAIQTIPGARLIRHARNLGVVAALNRGIQEASGDYFFLCSANDEYHVHLVEWCAEMLAQYPGTGVVSGNAAVWDDRQDSPGSGCVVPLPQVRARLEGDALVVALRRAATLFTPGVAIRRDRALALGSLDPELRWHCDWFLYHLVAFTAGYAFVPEPFTTIHVSADSRYSQGMFDWKQERETIRALVRRLNRYPEAADMFRRGALLPCYDLREVALLRSRGLRWMLTPLLIWRMVLHTAAYWLKSFLPRPFLTALRPWVRI